VLAPRRREKIVSYCSEKVNPKEVFFGLLDERGGEPSTPAHAKSARLLSMRSPNRESASTLNFYGERAIYFHLRKRERKK